ncbi:MAG: hypothetical protein EAZ81_06830 [Verrucomicrobia bacterium]|nr:MAG: hypothetical protein EAZ81_06830 [Verrucomicrobiota bacterium]
MKYRCPTCDQDAQVGRPCPHCARIARRKVPAAAKKSRPSWEQDEVYDGLDLPDDEEKASQSSWRFPAGIAWYWYGVALLLLVMMVGRVIYIR